MSNILNAALLYLSRGWSIIPIDITGPVKKPYVKWMEFQSRKATPEEVTRWFTMWPNAAIGIVTGKVSDLVVVDVDPRHGGSHQAILEAALTHLMVRSGGADGGIHLYYSYPDDVERVPNRVGIIQGVDVRGDGGYAVLPPSGHASGGQYSWIIDGIPGVMPSDMVDSIVRGTAANKVGKGDEPYWFSKLWTEGAPAGQRNDSCTRLAGYLAKKGIPKDMILTMLDGWNMNANADPLDAGDIKIIVDSVFRTKDRKSAPVHTDKDGVPKLFEFIGLNDYITKFGSSETRWTVEGWLPEKSITFMVAAPGSYKTWMLLDMAMAIATGSKFLGMYPVTQTGPVLVIQQEDFHGQMAERLSVILQSQGHGSLSVDSDSNFSIKMPDTIPVYLHPDRALRFNDIAVMDKLEEYIAELRPKVVMIDPLYSAASGDDYMAKAVDDMWRLKALRDKYGCSFIIAHHTKKLAKDNDTTAREDLWGSQFLNAFLETGWQIRTTDALNTIKVRRHFKSSANSDEMKLQFDINTEIYPFHYRVTEVEDKEEAKADEIVDFLRHNPHSDRATIMQNLGLHMTTVKRRLKALETDGMISKNKDELYFLTRQEVNVGH